jgi:hypothetical protein
MSDGPPRSAKLDLTIGLVGLWLSAGFLWDSWAHLHVGVESFFTPYHAIFYSAMLAGGLLLGVAAYRNYGLGYRGFQTLPAPYRQALIGVPVFFLGGVGDLFWHRAFGVENRIEAVTSPTHLIIGFGVVLVLSGPIRSALGARFKLRSLGAQLPLLFALASLLEFVHLGTSYAFDPSAARAYAPPDGVDYSPDYFTATAIGLYKAGSGVLVVLLQTLIMMGVSIWAAARFQLKPGFFVLLYVLGDGMISAALANDSAFLSAHLAMAAVAGLVADTIVARSRPSGSSRGLRIFGALVPLAYYGTYFAVTLALAGIWWNWSLVFGSLVWSALGGFSIALIAADPISALVVDVAPLPVDRSGPSTLPPVERPASS